jgi:hypothetical protein
VKKTKNTTTKQHAARSREALTQHIRPLVETFVEGLVDVAWKQLSSKLDRAMEAAVASLAEVESQPDPEPEEQPAASPRVRACSACGKPGHRRPSCPTRAAEPTSEQESVDDDSSTPSTPTAPRPALDRAQRYAQIEEAKARREATAR